MSALRTADVESESELKPVLLDEGLTFMYISHNNLYLLAVARANVNAVATLYFLHRLVDVFKYYFEACSLMRIPERSSLSLSDCRCWMRNLSGTTSSSVRARRSRGLDPGWPDAFAVYELFDEVMDFGFPQFTEAKIMADYIKTDAHKAEVHEVTQSMAVTNAVSWRAEGLKYKVPPTQLLRLSKSRR